ncbi:hypothetical protein Ahy_B09g097643 isoform B [Arachis hypogaea]|uniref:Uncharacterized protein n=1 Tax=Arachis hypogaea TaxID=3818 RepID=A0A444XPK0_ARAHY|nr:hypothetical protein Ahy_B09g097643 isoform B [Arachis hypogaea]
MASRKAPFRTIQTGKRQSFLILLLINDQVVGLFHLIVFMWLILAMDKYLKKAFIAAAIKSTLPSTATALMNFFEPAFINSITKIQFTEEEAGGEGEEEEQWRITGGRTAVRLPFPPPRSAAKLPPLSSPKWRGESANERMSCSLLRLLLQGIRRRRCWAIAELLPPLSVPWPWWSMEEERARGEREQARSEERERELGSRGERGETHAQPPPRLCRRETPPPPLRSTTVTVEQSHPLLSLPPLITLCLTTRASVFPSLSSTEQKQSILISGRNINSFLNILHESRRLTKILLI